MTGKRARYSAEFKTRVALDALRGELTTAQLATKMGENRSIYRIELISCGSSHPGFSHG